MLQMLRGIGDCQPRDSGKCTPLHSSYARISDNFKVMAVAQYLRNSSELAEQVMFEVPG